MTVLNTVQGGIKIDSLTQLNLMYGKKIIILEHCDVLKSNS